MKKQIIFLATICLASCSIISAQQSEPSADASPSLTIYNNNFAVVSLSLRISFEQGTNQLKFTDIASAIEPESVNFKCLSSPGQVSILEQSYEYGLTDSAGLLKQYIDKNITVALKGSGADTGKKLSGVLLALTGGDLILKSQTNDIEIISTDSIENISLKELPGELITRPTLTWLANAKEEGDQTCQITYTTGQIGWNADYSAVLNPDETKIDFTGWVTIDNKSGATYKDSFIKLIAGDVRKLAEPRLQKMELLHARAEAPSNGFEEKPFMEYHVYTLGRKSTINNNQVKQIEFIEPAPGVLTKKLYIFDRSRENDKIQVKLEFENNKENNLGIALPKGKVRVFKKNVADDSLEFVGEDKIDHTAKQEKVSLYIGNTFDVVPEYTLLDSQYDRRSTRETHKIEFQNRKKDEAVTVFVDEKFRPGVNWNIENSTHKHEKRDANTARFEVKLNPDSVVTIQYTATQSW